jgi:hypothetical protein
MTASLISPQVGGGAIRLRNEEEQMNKRPETQANRKNTSPSQASHHRLAVYKHHRLLVVETRLPDRNL